MIFPERFIAPKDESETHAAAVPAERLQSELTKIICEQKKEKFRNCLEEKLSKKLLRKLTQSLLFN